MTRPGPRGTLGWWDGQAIPSQVLQAEKRSPPSRPAEVIELFQLHASIPDCTTLDGRWAPWSSFRRRGKRSGNRIRTLPRFFGWTEIQARGRSHPRFVTGPEHRYKSSGPEGPSRCWSTAKHEGP